MNREELKKKRIGVLMGGLSTEREVSLNTGRGQAAALRSLGYDVVELDVGRDIAERLRVERVEVAFLALHGKWGEDGCIQGLLESMFIPYTGAGVLGSAVGMEKVASKQLFVGNGLKTAPYETYADVVTARTRGVPTFGFPLVVKPSREGSSMGVHICHDEAAWEAALDDLAARFHDRVLVEPFIRGREVCGAVLDGEYLGSVEIRPARDFYDYEAKYSKASGTQYVSPAEVSPEVEAKIRALSLGAHDALFCSGVTRSDFIVDAAGEAWLLEVNTLPGMTETSLVPKVARARGLSFEALCERVLLGASLKA